MTKEMLCLIISVYIILEIVGFGRIFINVYMYIMFTWWSLSMWMNC